LGYDENLPAPIAAVYITVAAMKAPEIHSFIQVKDKESISLAHDDGESLLLLIILYLV